MTAERLHDLLRDVPIPDERGAEERGWRVVRAAYGQRSPAARAGRRATRVAIAVALGALALALVLTPAGAKVADLVHDVVRPGEPNAEPELTSLPTAGRLLVTVADRGLGGRPRRGKTTPGRIRRRYLVAAWALRRRHRGQRADCGRARRYRPLVAVGEPSGQRPRLGAERNPDRLPRRGRDPRRGWRRDGRQPPGTSPRSDATRLGPLDLSQRAHLRRTRTTRCVPWTSSPGELCGARPHLVQASAGASRASSGRHPGGSSWSPNPSS